MGFALGGAMTMIRLINRTGKVIHNLLYSCPT